MKNRLPDLLAAFDGMRRGRPRNIWPAYADLMTILAVVGLLAALASYPAGARTRHLESENRRLRERLAESSRHLAEQQRRYDRQRRDAARNEQMFQAIQQVQGLVNNMPAPLSFGTDQSLQFGDDLVTFERNLDVPIWLPDGREQLHRFCAALSAELGQLLERSPGGEPKFILEIEGHTDSTTCPDDPDCNWRISGGRAANFVAVMRQENYCPGGNRWDLRPIGYADRKPSKPGGIATRRIAVRIIPDYRRIIAGLPGSP